MPAFFVLEQNLWPRSLWAPAAVEGKPYNWGEVFDFPASNLQAPTSNF